MCWRRPCSDAARRGRSSRPERQAVGRPDRARPRRLRGDRALEPRVRRVGDAPRHSRPDLSVDLDEAVVDGDAEVLAPAVERLGLRDAMAALDKMDVALSDVESGCRLLSLLALDLAGLTE